MVVPAFVRTAYPAAIRLAGSGARRAPPGRAYHPAMHSAADNPAAGSPRYLDRELSWLEFNARVLALAENASLPLLERAKFLAIFSSNLDEFFQVRVSGLKEQLEAGIRPTSPEGIDQVEQLRAIRDARRRARRRRQAAVFTKEVAPALQEAGVEFADWDDLDDEARAAAHPRVRRPHLPGAHAARRRPRAPVPVHLEPLAQPRRRRARPGDGRAAIRPRQGAAAAPPLRRACRAARASSRSSR